MKTKLLLVLILLAQTFYGQEITGSWKGELDLGGMTLPLILDITKENNTYVSTAKSPKQGNQIINVDKTEFINNELVFEMKALNASYKGQFKADHFEGTFSQNSKSFPLSLYKNDGKEKPAPKVLISKDIKKAGINTAKIDDFLNYITQNKEGIGSITLFKDGKEIYQKNFGQDQLSNVKWDSNTGYQIGSVSKLFTAIMLMQLEEKGKLNLNDKLSKYYPDAPNANKITLEHIMNHTSGLGDYAGGWLFGKSVGDKAILDTIRKHGVEFQPGEKERYSNSGYYLLSRILEDVSKKPYNVLLKENITSKANMKNTFSVLDNQKNIFKSYENTTGKWMEVEDFDFRNCIGLGDITSTTHDLSLFINALFDYKFVKKETLDRMLPKGEKPFGLGIMKAPFYNKVSYGHGGDTAGTHTLVSYSPTENYSIATVINGEKLSHGKIFLGIVSLIYDQEYEYPKFTELKKASEKELQKYEGNYYSKETKLDFKIFIKEEILFAQLTYQPSFPLEYVEGNTFKYDNAGVEIIFSPENKQLSLIQNGNTLVFDKK
ncbi:serine hydrolase domain-containing protein [Chryseobacterium sp. 3008163]|uniref:serine hydrolase domain-containing protein n=1 Tax=Chryseobacterium sp. 3008163 TaxID=2478663 RepID=UPI000F0D098B|nr:serine hydrolase domain-containing protein [Chryseobacterium sp. 3008163]AYN01905.1 class A beta-lactamase-related serine hydrolase [Chryseobacterium sp. 3008163]